MDLTRWDYIDSKVIKSNGWKMTTAQTCREGRSEYAGRNQVVLAFEKTLNDWVPKALALYQLQWFPTCDEENYAKSRLVYEIACKSRHGYKREAALRLLNKIGTTCSSSHTDVMKNFANMQKAIQSLK